MRERLEDQLNYYRSRSRTAKTAYLRVKLVQIVIGAAVPVLAASGVTGWVTAAVAAVPVVAEGIQQLFQWHSTWLRCRSTAEALKTEKFLYITEAGPYAEGSRSTLLAERITRITGKETDDWAESNKSEFEKQKKS
ncbi:DUF4231 domain-containing protein [Nocardia sp. NBC_01009]|uniref:DUF4231 domain-containing protein n=1 Tax=Nocardia sp. NBC_01009 TaxID=2975996 RepID=UPI00386D7F16|nr:DUF4231 domain-containing protein [Nocardia sp. NBC_01009]